ncbi:MAG: hypothetical protein AABM32_02845 [Chloroflexota bacterium]
MAGIGDRFDLVAGFLQHGTDEASDISIVVDNEDSPAQRIASWGGGGFLLEHL